MAGNTQMNENERGIFKLSGITGMLIATLLLLTILAVLTVFGIKKYNKMKQRIIIKLIKIYMD